MKQIITDRRALHRIPELDRELDRTMAYLRTALKGLRCRVFAPVPNSLCAFFDNESDSAIAFRCGCDGLPVHERSFLPYASQLPGQMHACGHDGHMAMLLELARRMEGAHVDRNILLIFQPAEETTGGAQRMIAEGALERPRVEAVFGFHLMPQVPKGCIALSAGGVMDANTEFDLTFTGTRAHGAMPHLGADAAAALAQTYLALQTYMTRAVPPNAPAVLTAGHISAGNLRNIVADTAVLEAILRTYDNAMQDRLIEEFQRIAASVSSVYGVSTGFAQHCFYPAVINDAALVDRVRPLIDHPLPQEALLTAEDFSFFGKERPAVYAFVGAGDEKRSAPLHSDQFDFDEAALLPAIDWYTRIIDTCAKED